MVQGDDAIVAVKVTEADYESSTRRFSSTRSSPT